MPGKHFFHRRRWFAYLLKSLVTGAVCFLLIVLLGSLLRSTNGSFISQDALTAAQRASHLPSPIDWTKIINPDDPGTYPTMHVHVDLAQGPAAAWYPKGESPILHQMVEQGKLPPVAQRVGPEPCVMRGCDGIGRYGGTWMRLATTDNDVYIIANRLSNTGLVRWSPFGDPIEPHLAKSIESRGDNKQFIITFRKGVRWSDGVPFTVDDIMYWWQDEVNNENFGRGRIPPWLTAAGQPPVLEKIDDYTLRITFPQPYGTFLQVLASRSQDMCESPKHYLIRYHPDFGDPDFIERERTNNDQPSARALYNYLRRFDNPEHPRLWPWICRQYRNNPPYIYVRNPYYFAVDEQGNQLPYIDRIQFDVQDGNVMPQSFSNGYVSMQTRHVRFDNYTELMSRAKAAHQRILSWYPATRSTWAIYPNAQRFVPGNPKTLDDCPNARTRELLWKRKLLADPRFRKALSVAIDRKAIIHAEYNDQCEPAQVEPGPLSPYADPDLGNAFIQYDPKLADQMLDEIGLTQRDLTGMRRFPDGSPMTFFLDFTPFTGVGPAQFIVDDWARVGVRVIARNRARSLFYTQKAARDVDMTVWSSESDHFPLMDGRCFAPTGTEANWGVGWGRWFQLGGLYGNPQADITSATPPPAGSPVLRSLQLFSQAQFASSETEQKRLVRDLLDLTAEQLWTINISTAPPQLVVVSDNMKNVPAHAMYAVVTRTPGNAGIETYYFEKSNDNAAAVADTTQQLETNPVLPSRAAALAAATQSNTAYWGEMILRVLIIGVIGALVLMMILRHPFIGRRLLIMVPTLIIISIIVFTIIQLPPGDYLTSRILQIQESGDTQAESQLDDLRKQFHFEDSGFKKYLRWTGILWFLPADRTKVSPELEAKMNWFERHGMFQDRNAGLLEGNLGRSMESSKLVSDVVGDRILLTFLISAGTIMMTWMIAIPIGIYSAVRQYSATDYLFTLVGFIGMSVPGFLLALVLGVTADVQGLFSPQFAAQPGWSWAKMLDLLGHIWVPIIVMGITGTAGMIRVMRANLLDELRKPYVVTARAKGVRPIKLLLKYPVRVALNPFVSGIGHIFPQLVSGGAIVAVVLSLPTVGPLLLNALFSEDMYLAGSMLMVLSLLGVLGTLVSDILLLWLDPRIRYE